MTPLNPQNPIPHESLEVRLARIETKLDAFLASQTDQETRIRKVEGRVTGLFGGGSIMAAFIAVFAALNTFTQPGG